MKIKSLNKAIFYFSSVYSVSQLLLNLLINQEFILKNTITILFNNFVAGLIIAHLLFSFIRFFQLRKTNKENLFSMFLKYKIAKPILYKLIFFFGLGSVIVYYLISYLHGDFTLKVFIILVVKSFGISLFFSFFLFWIIAFFQKPNKNSV